MERALHGLHARDLQPPGCRGQRRGFESEESDPALYKCAALPSPAPCIILALLAHMLHTRKPMPATVVANARRALPTAGCCCCRCELLLLMRMPSEGGTAGANKG